MNVRLQARKLGYFVRYVHHKVIADYNATYNVEYQGKNIFTNAAKQLARAMAAILRLITP